MERGLLQSAANAYAKQAVKAISELEEMLLIQYWSHIQAFKQRGLMKDVTKDMARNELRAAIQQAVREQKQ